MASMFFLRKPKATLDTVYWHPHLIVSRLYHAAGYATKQPGFSHVTLDDLNRAVKDDFTFLMFSYCLDHDAIPRWRFSHKIIGQYET